MPLALHFLLSMPSETPSPLIPDAASAPDSRLSARAELMHPVFRAALLNGSEKLVRLHLQRGSDIDGRDVRGLSPLMLAASRGHLDVCRLLLEAGADAASCTTDGHDAAAIAERNGHPRVAALLRSGSGYAAEPLSASVFVREISGSADEAEEYVSGDLSGWIEETLTVQNPEEDVTSGARQLHTRLSEHVPADHDTDWSDVPAELPVNSRRRTAPQVTAGSPQSRIRRAAEEITARNGTPAALIDVMGHPATRGMIYRTIRAEYVKWRASLEEQPEGHSAAQRDSAAVQNGAPVTDTSQGSVLRRAGLTSAQGAGAPSGNSAGGRQEGAGSTSGRPDTPPVSSGRTAVNVHVADNVWNVPRMSAPLARKLWLAADELTAREGMPATVGELMRHPVTRGMTYRNVRAEYLKWLAAYKHQNGETAQNKTVQREAPQGQNDVAGISAPGPAGTDNMTRPSDPADTAAADVRDETENIPDPATHPRSVRQPPMPHASWDEVATYLAGCASLTVSDTRAGKGYFWVLMPSVDTDELRGLARKLLFMGFQHVAGLGFRRR